MGKCLETLRPASLEHKKQTREPVSNTVESEDQYTELSFDLHTRAMTQNSHTQVSHTHMHIHYRLMMIIKRQEGKGQR